MSSPSSTTTVAPGYWKAIIAPADGILSDNEIIEVYEHDNRARYVLLGRVAERSLHVVVAQDDIVNATVVISVYEPDEAHGWDPASGFRNRKEDADGR